MICPSCNFDNIEGVDRCENCMQPLRDIDIPRADATAGIVRSVMEDDLNHLIHGESLIVAPDETALEVIRRMNEADAQCVLVVDGGKLVGIFTEHDVLNKLAGVNARELSASVKELMSENPETLKEADSVAAALNKMSIGRYRHVPIIKSDGSYAVASIKHVLRYIAQEDW
ncbi:MAG: CBS domain-containing protein [Pyrinomonadaceae bacterium]